MEFLEGEYLRHALSRRGALPVPGVAEILQQACTKDASLANAIPAKGGIHSAHQWQPGTGARDTLDQQIGLKTPFGTAAPTSERRLPLPHSCSEQTLMKELTRHIRRIVGNLDWSYNQFVGIPCMAFCAWRE
jgi:hypothetical protein